MLTAVIVGAGFSGIAAGIALKRAGIQDFVILEKADRVGGTWRENTYPGAACDVPSHLYSYSFEPNPSWSRAYGGQAEILAYLEHCVDKYNLRPHLKFGQHVDEARFDETTGTWHVTTCAPGMSSGPDGSASRTSRAADGSASTTSRRPDGSVSAKTRGPDGSTNRGPIGSMTRGTREHFEARGLLLGNGALHLPALPDIPGLDSFAGKRFHSAQWQHDYDLAGKRVAVIGTGASAIQFVPEIAPKVAHLDVYQRTAPWVVPKRDRAIASVERWLYEHVPAAHWLRRTGLYWLMESRVVGFAYAPKVNEVLENVARYYLKKAVRDPELRAKLTPTYRFGCKRVLISNDWYPALQRDNVDVVTDRIERITPRGVRTVDGIEREVDALILGTGFRVTEYLSAIRITGRGGLDLNEEWRTSLRNYLGISVSGFPNLFLLMGPNTGLGHNSMIFMIEAQARYAANALAEVRRRGLAYIDVTPSAEQAFRAELAEKMKNTVWTTGCQSWYQTPDGEVFLWPGATFDYWWRTRTVPMHAYEMRALPKPMRRAA